MVRKVLALVDNVSGSRLHRIKEPLSRMKNVEVTFQESKSFKEEMLEGMDILWVNRKCPIDSVSLERALKEKNVKYVIDLDDCVNVGDRHILKYVFDMEEPLLIRHLILADLVIVSDGYLIPQVLPYNDVISLIPNRIPFEEGQFKLEDKVEDEKIRFGIIGSISHYYDYLSLRNVMKKVLGDAEFQQKAKIVIAANPSHKYWKDVINIFTHKNVELEILDLRGVDDYMELYNHVDVVLAPLEEEHFNKARTNLKIYEAACKEIPVIGSHLYLDKGVNCFVPIYKSGDWYEAIKYFIKNRNYRQFGKEVREFLMKETPYSFVVEKREGLVDILMGLKKEEVKDVKIHSIIYDQNQKADFEVYDNSHIKTVEQRSYLFEWNAILDISSKLTNLEGYIGVFSHKFPQKTGLSPKILNRLLLKNNYQHYDFINLSPQHWKTGREYLQFSEEQHPGLIERLEEICKAVGLKYWHNLKYVNFSNFYITKIEVFNDYVNNYITPAIAYMENNKDRFMIDAQYKGGLNSEELKKVSGLDFYSFHAFILERLILMYLENKNLKVLNLI